MSDAMRIRTEIPGAVVAAICCASPTFALAGRSASAWSAWADDVAVPVILALVALAAFGVPVEAIRSLGRVLRGLWHAASRFLAHR